MWPQERPPGGVLPFPSSFAPSNSPGSGANYSALHCTNDWYSRACTTAQPRGPAGCRRSQERGLGRSPRIKQLFFWAGGQSAPRKSALNDRPNLDTLIPLRTDRDEIDRAADQRLDPAHVVLRGRRKVLESPRRGRLGLPAGHRFQNRPALGEQARAGGEGVDPLATCLVCGAKLDCPKAVEDVESRQHGVLHAVRPRRVARRDRIKPAAATRPAGDSPVLLTVLTQPLALFVQQLRRHRTVANAGLVRLVDSDDTRNLIGPDADPEGRSGG